MALFRIRVTEGPGVQILKKHSGNLSGALQRIGQYLVRLAQSAFANQRHAGIPWAPRHVPSILGVIQDLESGPSVKAERFQPRPVLVVTGALRRSLYHQATGPKTVVVRSTVPYARLMNDGGESSRSVTPEVKQNLAEYLRANKGMRPLLGFLFHRDEVHTEVQPRDFLSIPPEARPKIQKLIRDQLEEGRA